MDWSPDDEQLVFHGSDNDDEIYTIDADGSNLQKLTDNYPSWSTDGTLAFVSDRSGSRQLYTMDSDGSNVQQITSNGGTIPNWSPDGSKIAFHSRRSGDREVYIMNSDGTGPLINMTVDGSSDYVPSWSPVE